jgi:hypothetical protein
MIGIEPNSIYLGKNTSDGTPVKLQPFKPSPGRTNNGRKLFKALNNTTLITADQAGTPYQFSFIISLSNAIGAVSIYNNTNAGITFDASLNAGGTVAFSVTDINGTSTITTTQVLEVGWSYELTFQYIYNGEIGFNRSDFMRIFINGILTSWVINFDGLASVTPALAASTLTVISSADTYVLAIAQWWYAWWVSMGAAFAWQWWYYWWYAWWRSWWWNYWYYWWWWYVWWDCVITGCDPNDCGPNACHPAAPFDTIYHYETRKGDIDFVLAGKGIRDIDTNMTPAVINITVPGPVVKAYLYWNTIGGPPPPCPDTAIFNGDSGAGDIIGCCGNTCWSVYCVNSGQDTDDTVPDQNLLNKVWFRDVTSLVPGTGSYTVSIPNVVPGDFIAYAASDSPYYPGCQGGQGVALLVIYETEPYVTTRQRFHCCKPIGEETVLVRKSREIIIYHGAKLLSFQPPKPPTIGGSSSHSITFQTKYSFEGKLANGVGDAQSEYADNFSFNGVSLPPFPSYFNPDAGNLLHVKTEYLPKHSIKCGCGPNGHNNTVTASTPDDCLCWFLFVFSGAQICITKL